MTNRSNDVLYNKITYTTSVLHHTDK